MLDLIGQMRLGDGQALGSGARLLRVGNAVQRAQHPCRFQGQQFGIARPGADQIENAAHSLAFLTIDHWVTVIFGRSTLCAPT